MGGCNEKVNKVTENERKCVTIVEERGKMVKGVAKIE